MYAIIVRGIIGIAVPIMVSHFFLYQVYLYQTISIVSRSFIRFNIFILFSAEDSHF